MYLILSDADDNVSSSRASEVFHDGVDVIGLRAVEEEKVHRRRSTRKGWFVGEDPPEKVYRKRSVREGSLEKVL